MVKSIESMYSHYNNHNNFSHLHRASCYYRTFPLPTDAQENCFQRSIKIYIQITMAATCFGVIAIIRESTVWACWRYSVKTVG